MGTVEGLQIPPKNEEATYPGLSFITIVDPGESKLPSQRKAVRSHAALYQASKTRLSSKLPAQKKQPRKRKRKAIWHGDVIILNMDSSSKSKYEDWELLLPAELRGQIARQFSSSGMRLLGAGRVDPFRTYPVPWEPFIPELVDHCSYLLPFLPKVSNMSADLAIIQILSIWPSICPN